MNIYKNYEWYLTQDLGKYAGKWLAIFEEEIVDSDKKVEILMKRIKKKYPGKKPIITKVRNKLSIL